MNKNYKDIENYDGVIEATEIFDLDLDEGVLLKNFRRAITDSEGYWNRAKGFNLAEIRQENKKLWLGNHYDEYELHDHQTPYIDNRTFISVESSIAYVTAKVAQPEVYPAQDTDVSKYLAQDLQRALVAHAELDRLDQKARRISRHAYIAHLGMGKLRYDYDKDCIVTEVVDPECIVVDKDAKEGDNPRFIAEYLDASVEELIHRFPDSKDKIMAELGYKRGTTLQMQKRIRYIEIWFTYYDKSNSKCEGVMWFFNNCVLGKMKNPNWVYKDSKEEKYNFLDHPPKPYIPLNFYNDGMSYIDPTGAIQQAAPLQYALDKRGRQIVDNADQANAGWVFSGHALSKSDAEAMIGAPNEKIIVDAEDVRTAAQRFPAPILPAYVIQDKFDMRTEMDQVFGTPNIFRGESSGSATLGQDVIAKQQSQIRQDIFVDAIDDWMHKYYRMLVQFMKVYYTEDHWYRISGKNGQFDSIVMKADKIEDGIDVRITAGSTVKVDKDRMQTVALTLAKLGLIDPISIYEDLELPNPADRIERLVQWKLDPTVLVENAKNDEFDQQAFIDITILNAGKKAKPQEIMSQEHLDYHRKYMISSEFISLPDKIKQLHVDHVTLETETLRQLLLLEQTQMPTPAETQQMMPGQPPMPNAPQGGQAPAGQPPMQGNMPPNLLKPTSNPASPQLGSAPTLPPSGGNML